MIETVKKQRRIFKAARLLNLTPRLAPFPLSRTGEGREATGGRWKG
jgi:hypothetical protein